MTTTQVLLWIATGGGAALIFSWAADQWAWYQALDQTWKQIVYYVGVAFLAVLAFAGVQYIPASVFAFLDPYLNVVMVALGLGVAGTAWHSLRK